MDLQMQQRHYYVTGVSGGIGMAVGLCLVGEGAVVHGCARSEVGLQRFREALPSGLQESVRLDAVDVTDEAVLAASVDAAGAVSGKLDGIVACAGAGISGGALETGNDRWRQQFDVKVIGVLNLFRPAVKWLERSDAARAVIINGVTAHHPEPVMAAVSASRAAVANLGRTLAVELAGRVSVTVVNVGAVLTARQRARWESSASSLSFDDWVSEQVTQRDILAGRLGDPNEAAAVATFLLSPRSSYITGTSVDVAGGSHGRV